MLRNGPCYCGSGVKYKKCHMKTDKEKTSSTESEIKPPEFGVLTKVSSRGLSHALTTRLFFGISQIRDRVIQKEDSKRSFDRVTAPLFDSIWEAGFSKENVQEIIKRHTENVELGKAAKIENEGRQITVEEDVSVELRVALKGVFLFGGIALSYLNKIATHLGYDIKFLYGNDKEFEQGIKKFLEKNNTEVMRYLVDRIRLEREGWYSSFIKLRNEITHKGWELPKIRYGIKDGKPIVIFPNLSPDLTISNGCQFLFNRLFEFTEDVIALLLVTKLPKTYAMLMIPEDKRDGKMPLKYKIVIAPEIAQKIREAKAEDA